MKTDERDRALQPSLFADPGHERRQAQRMRGEKAVIKVAYGNPCTPEGACDPGPTFRERDATVYGPLALMPAVVFDRHEGRSRHEGWNVTHVASGLALAPSIPEKAEALRAIYLLKDEDWSFSRKHDLPADLRLKVRRVVEEASAGEGQ